MDDTIEVLLRLKGFLDFIDLGLDDGPGSGFGLIRREPAQGWQPDAEGGQAYQKRDNQEQAENFS